MFELLRFYSIYLHSLENTGNYSCPIKYLREGSATKWKDPSSSSNTTGRGCRSATSILAYRVFHCSLCAECCSPRRGCCSENRTPDSSSASLSRHRRTTETRSSSHLNTEKRSINAQPGSMRPKSAHQALTTCPSNLTRWPNNPNATKKAVVLLTGLKEWTQTVGLVHSGDICLPSQAFMLFPRSSSPSSKQKLQPRRKGTVPALGPSLWTVHSLHLSGPHSRAPEWQSCRLWQWKAREKPAGSRCALKCEVLAQSPPVVAEDRLLLPFLSVWCSATGCRVSTTCSFLSA